MVAPPTEQPSRATGIISPATAEAFAEQGFVHCRSLLTPGRIGQMATHALRVAIHHLGDGQPHAEKHTALGHNIQLRNTWQFDEHLRSIVLDLQLATIAGTLLGEPGVQLYSDLITVREPGAEESPWHVDAAHMLVAGEAVIVAYIPLDGNARSGSLEIIEGSHLLPEARELKVHRVTSARRVTSRLRRSSQPIVKMNSAPGDVVFFAGNTFHRKPANTTRKPLTSLWVYYFAAGQTALRPKNPFQSMERELHFPDSAPGRPICTPTTPLLWGEVA